MKCPSCNNSINDTYKYCPKCGLETPGAKYFVSDTSYLSWKRIVDSHRASREKSLIASVSVKSQETIPNSIDSHSLPKSVSTPTKTDFIPNTTSKQINSNKQMITAEKPEKNERSAGDIGMNSNKYNGKYNQSSLQNTISNKAVNTSSSAKNMIHASQKGNCQLIHQLDDNQQQSNKHFPKTKRSKSNSIACMVCGIVSVVLSFIGFLLFFSEGIKFSFLFFIAALICFGICLLHNGRCRRIGERNGFSRAGKATGIVGFSFSIVCGIVNFFIIFTGTNINSQTLSLPVINDTIIERIEKMDRVETGNNFAIYNEDFNECIVEARWWDYDSTMDKPGVYSSDVETLGFSIEANKDVENEIYYAYYYSKDKKFDKHDLSKPIFSDTISPVEYGDGRTFYNVDCSKSIQDGYYVVIVASDKNLATPYLVAYAEVK